MAGLRPPPLGRFYVFVYGTLKKGQPNHFLMEDAANGSAQLLADCQLVDRYPLVIASRFNIPFLLRVKGTGLKVKGQVFLVDEPMLNVLDQLEEHPAWYKRELVPCKVLKTHTPGLEPGVLLDAWCYFLPRYKPVLLEQAFHEDYDTNGPHGLKYVLGRNREVPPGFEKFDARTVMKHEVSGSPLQ